MNPVGPRAHYRVAPPTPFQRCTEAVSRIGSRYLDVMVRVATFGYKVFRGFVDSYFPEPVNIPQPPGEARPIAQLPEEERPVQWKPERFIQIFQENDDKENSMVLFRAVVSHKEKGAPSPIEFCEMLRGMKVKVPEFAQEIQRSYCMVHGTEVSENFYERNDISVEGIYDAAIYLQMEGMLATLKGEDAKVQAQTIVDLIPPHIKDSQEFNRVRAQVWHALCQTKMLDVLLGMVLQTLGDEIKASSASAYIKPRDCDLGLVRKAAIQLAK